MVHGQSTSLKHKPLFCTLQHIIKTELIVTCTHTATQQKKGGKVRIERERGKEELASASRAQCIEWVIENVWSVCIEHGQVLGLCLLRLLLRLLLFLCLTCRGFGDGTSRLFSVITYTPVKRFSSFYIFDEPTVQNYIVLLLVILSLYSISLLMCHDANPVRYKVC